MITVFAFGKVRAPGAWEELRISPYELAEELAYIRRFKGRGESVCSHSVRVTEIFRDRHPEASKSQVLAALLHDAHEAITGDVAHPVKRQIDSARLWELENWADYAIWNALGRPEVGVHEGVKTADELAANWELRKIQEEGECVGGREDIDRFVEMYHAHT